MEDIEWNVMCEGRLLDAMIGHKPVGVNKYFQMAFICDKFTETMNKDVNPDKIWSHLGTMYNLEALDENESIPFPNNEKDFFLPESDFGSLLVKKEEDKKPAIVTPKPPAKEPPRQAKDTKPEEKTPSRSSSKESLRRDSKDSKDNVKTPAPAKKEPKKEVAEKEKGKGNSKSRNSTAGKDKDETKVKNKNDELKLVKRPTRASLKPEDSSSSGKSSPVTVTPTGAKRRRL